LYVILFPQLVAGPIVRYKTIENEIISRKTTLDSFCYGLERFIIGFAKKLIIANNVGELADTIFEYGNLDASLAWLGAIAYTLQIYFDFSAYSDMAIGLGTIFGFHFKENFNYPYISQSITEFWRRWHISLSTWFRDYIYIPLGGNRKGIKRQLVNMLVVWGLTGMWHGASWNFIIWGLYYFTLLTIEKIFLGKLLEKIPKIIRWLYAIFAVMIGWIIFRAESIEKITKFLYQMMSFQVTDKGRIWASVYFHKYAIYLLMGVVLSTPVYKWINHLLIYKANNQLFIFTCFVWH
jgi:alginate O-acetyltransferase complex protein AlgI